MYENVLYPTIYIVSEMINSVKNDTLHGRAKNI